jgi:hypothetical protein
VALTTCSSLESTRAAKATPGVFKRLQQFHVSTSLDLSKPINLFVPRPLAAFSRVPCGSIGIFSLQLFVHQLQIGHAASSVYTKPAEAGCQGVTCSCIKVAPSTCPMLFPLVTP